MFCFKMMIVEALVLISFAIFTDGQVITDYEFENVVGGAGKARSPWRSGASKNGSLHMFKGDKIELKLCLTEAVTLTVNGFQFSNDGLGDTISVSVDNHNIGQLETLSNDNGWGKYWNEFKTTSPVGMSRDLTIGEHKVVLNVESADCHGTEFDKMSFDSNIELNICDAILVKSDTPSLCAQRIDAPTTIASTDSTPSKTDATTQSSVSEAATESSSVTSSTASTSSKPDATTQAPISDSPTESSNVASSTVSSSSKTEKTTKASVSETPTESSSVKSSTDSTPSKTDTTTQASISDSPTESSSFTSSTASTSFQTDTTTHSSVSEAATESSSMTSAADSTSPKTDATTQSIVSEATTESSRVTSAADSTTPKTDATTQSSVSEAATESSSVTSAADSTASKTNATTQSAISETATESSSVTSSTDSTSSKTEATAQSSVPEAATKSPSVTSSTDSTSSKTDVTTHAPVSDLPTESSSVTSATDSTSSKTEATTQSSVSEAATKSSSVTSATDSTSSMTEATTQSSVSEAATKPSSVTSSTDSSSSKTDATSHAPVSDSPTESSSVKSSTDSTSSKTEATTQSSVSEAATESSSVTSSADSTSSKSEATTQTVASNSTTESTVSTITSTTEAPKTFIQQLSLKSKCLDSSNIHVRFNPVLLKDIQIISRAVSNSKHKFIETSNDHVDSKLCKRTIWQIGRFDNSNNELGSSQEARVIDYEVNINSESKLSFPGVVIPDRNEEIIIRYIVPQQIDIKRGVIHFTIGLINVTKDTKIGVQFYDRSKKNPSSIENVTFNANQRVMGWELPTRSISPSLENQLHIFFPRSPVDPILIDFMRLDYTEHETKYKRKRIANIPRWKIRGLEYKKIKRQPTPKGMSLYVDGGKEFSKLAKITILKKPSFKVLSIDRDGKIYPQHDNRKHRREDKAYKGAKYEEVTGIVLGKPTNSISKVEIDTKNSKVTLTYEDATRVKFSYNYSRIRSKLIIEESSLSSNTLDFYSTHVSDYMAAVNYVKVNHKGKTPIFDDLSTLKGKRFTFVKTSPNPMYEASSEVELVFPRKSIPRF